MAKSSGLGQGILIAGVDLSGDVGSLSGVQGGNSPFDVTGIDKSAHERIGGLLDGSLSYTAFFNDARAHLTLRTLPTTDVHIAYFMASTLGAEAACMVSKQIDYPGDRGTDGSFLFNVPHAGNGYALEWCNLLTAGKRTDTAGTNGTGVDGTAASTTGWSAYLQVVSLTGTNVVITLEDSADNAAFATFTGSAFTSATAAATTERIEGAAGATVRRYVRAVSSGTFTSATFLVALTRHPVGATA